MKLESITLSRVDDTDVFVGQATFTDALGAVQVDLDPTIVANMLTIYDTAIAGLSQKIADELVADSVKRKGGK